MRSYFSPFPRKYTTFFFFSPPQQPIWHNEGSRGRKQVTLFISFIPGYGCAVSSRRSEKVYFVNLNLLMALSTVCVCVRARPVMDSTKRQHRGGGACARVCVLAQPAPHRVCLYYLLVLLPCSVSSGCYIHTRIIYFDYIMCQFCHSVVGWCCPPL